MIRGGYRGKILRVDLTTGSLTTEPLPDETVLRKYIGNFGLGLWYLMKELPDGISPVEPENPLIFMNGPVVGTKLVCPNNCTITTLNGDTEYTAGRAHSHGWFAANLSMAGLDGIIITGISPRWVYLWVDDGKVELRDASGFIGKDTHETEDLVKQDLGLPLAPGAKGGASVATIGPAGENLCAGAFIENDKNHSWCHSGVGRIMGSKRLKAIAVRGSSEVPVFDEQKLPPIVREWNSLLQHGPAQNVSKGGVPRHDYAVTRYYGLSARNLTANTLPGWGVGMSRQKVTPKPCYRCPIGCAYDIEVLDGAHKGFKATMGGGGENMEGAASIVGVGAADPGEIFYLTDLVDRLGWDSATIGCSMAVAFEAYEKGLLTKDLTDGLELKWGDFEVTKTLLQKIAHREGFGNILADGPLTAAQRVGLPDAAVHIKGSGMNIHDWRRGWPVLLSQFIGGGSGWGAPGAFLFAEADAGYPERDPRLTPFGKARQVAKTGILKSWHDCYGCCWFSTWGIPGILKLTSDAVAAVVGWDDFTPEEAWLVGERILNMERVFNVAHGLTAEDDYKVSPRLSGPVPADAPPDAAGKSVAPYVEGWVRDYYREMGWDPKTGKPLKSTLQRLGLEDLAALVWD